MNQILLNQNNNINDINYNYIYRSNAFVKKRKRKNKIYLLIFLSSLIICIIILFYFLYSYFLKLYEQEKTNILKERYNISTLYSTNSNYEALKLSNEISIIGLLDIPKINISYPILSNSSEDLLKISVCRFSGPLPNRIGNLCVAGHNYNNTLMFSKLNRLNIGDSLFVTDLNNTRLEYIIYNKSKVKENNLSCIQNSNNVEITLITCNTNNNKERIVIKAKVKG